MRKTVLIERLPDCADPPIHHIGRRDHVDTRLRIRARGAHEQIDGAVVIDFVTCIEQSAVTVISILAVA